jgi:hypothetical protein
MRREDQVCVSMEHHPIEYNYCINTAVRCPGMRRGFDPLPYLFFCRHREIRFEPVTFELEGPNSGTL